MLTKALQLGAVILVVTVAAVTCEDDSDYFGHEYTVVNEFPYDVVIYTGDGEDPTGFTPEQTNTAVGGGFSCGDHPTDWSHVIKSGTVPSGESAVLEERFFSGWQYYFVQGNRTTEGTIGGTPVFIRRFTWDELEELDWTVVMEPGWEVPTWGPPCHHVTLRNNLGKPVWTFISGADESGEQLLGRGLVVPWLWPGETGIANWAVTTERPYWVVTAREKLESGQYEDYSTIGETLFIRRFTWNELESLDWTVVIEPGYEEPTW